jgi:hypothetical protein
MSFRFTDVLSQGEAFKPGTDGDVLNTDIDASTYGTLTARN